MCVLHWRDTRDVLILSTCYTDETVQIHRRGTIIQKPKVVIDYNTGKSFIDLSDQIKQSNISINDFRYSFVEELLKFEKHGLLLRHSYASNKINLNYNNIFMLPTIHFSRRRKNTARVFVKKSTVS